VRAFLFPDFVLILYCGPWRWRWMACWGLLDGLYYCELEIVPGVALGVQWLGNWLDNWGIGASFLAVAQTFLMMWHNQTSKCLYTFQHCMFQHLYILHLHCYCWFTACCWCAEGSLLQRPHSTPAAVINQCRHRRWRTYMNWNASVVTECYNVCVCIIWSYMVCMKERSFSSP